MGTNHLKFTKCSTFTRVHGTNEIVAFGLNNYAQLAVHEQEQLFFNPKSTTIQNVKFISGNSIHRRLRLHLLFDHSLCDEYRP